MPGTNRFECAQLGQAMSRPVELVVDTGRQLLADEPEQTLATGNGRLLGTYCGADEHAVPHGDE